VGACGACLLQMKLTVLMSLLHVVQVDADDQYWDASSDPHRADMENASSSARPWWQGSYSLRMWGPEFLPIQHSASPTLVPVFADTGLCRLQPILSLSAVSIFPQFFSLSWAPLLQKGACLSCPNVEGPRNAHELHPSIGCFDQ